MMEVARAYIEKEKPRVVGPTEVADLMRPILLAKEQEEFWVLLLNSKNRLLHMVQATVGLVDRTQIHAREVFREAIVANTTNIVMVHNHPSGDPTPSAQDIASTRNLVATGKIIGIEVLDHIVMGKRTETRATDFLSFREQNLI